MSRTMIVLGVLAIVVIYLMKKNLRIEKIDFLNLNVGANGKWTQMSIKELNDVYSVWKLMSLNIKPDDQDYLQMLQVLKKYDIGEEELKNRKIAKS